jgi:hypothetical protein
VCGALYTAGQLEHTAGQQVCGALHTAGQLEHTAGQQVCGALHTAGQLEPDDGSNTSFQNVHNFYHSLHKTRLFINNALIMSNLTFTIKAHKSKV